MKTSRQRIVEYLFARPNAMSLEIARALQLSQADVRHHLSNLTQEGVVVVSGTRKPAGRGRPNHLYMLASQAQEHNLDQLASHMLTQLFTGADPIEQRELLHHLARQLAGLDPTRTPPGSYRLLQTVRRLNELHYRSRWEARRGAPHVILGHCPYAAILGDHPELCHLDALLIGFLSVSPAEQLKKLAEDPGGGHYCLFQLAK